MPDWAREVRARLASLRLSPAREAEIVEELSQDLDDRWRELIAGGASPDDAERLALAAFRSRDALAEHMAPLRQAHVPPPITPGQPGRHLLRDLAQDLRYALRTIAARPGFAIVAVLSLALGVGANTAIFSLWNGVLHAPLPGVRAPGELVILSDPDRSGGWTGSSRGARSWLTYEEFVDLRDRAASFSGVMASQASLFTWQVRYDGGAREEARGRFVSGEFFDVLGVGAAIGRVFTAADAGAEAAGVVIGHGYWQRRFGGRADVLGKTLVVHKAPLTIVGVAAAGFIGETSGQQPDFWLPLRLQPHVRPDRDRLRDTPPTKSMWLHVFGRLKPGVTLAQADAESNAIFRAGLETFYGAAAPSGARRRDLLDQRLELRTAARGASSSRTLFSGSLTALLAAVGVLLLIACANLANLLLARAMARTSEIAVRLSLGASHGRLVRQLVTESAVVAAIGGAAAVGVAFALHGALVHLMAQSDEDFRMTFAFDPLVLAFLFAATVAAALVFGVLPAWQATRTDAAASLREQGRAAIGTRREMRSSRYLVSLQLALSLPLLVGAGLLAQTAYNLRHADLGYPAERLLLVRIDAQEAGYESVRRDNLLRELRTRIQQVPGVRAASFSQLGLFTGGESSETIHVDGYTPRTDADRESALDVVGPGYFATLGAPILRGRDIDERDRDRGVNVCVINEAFARRFFERRDPIGMRITLTEAPGRPSYQVVGIAKNARTTTLRGDVEPRFYLPVKEPSSSANSPTFLIRTATDAGPIMAAVRQTIQRVDANLPIIAAVSIEEQMRPLTAQDRAVAQLAAVFGSVALALAVVGLYGMLSYGIVRRTSEIAMRIALGAQAGRVIAMILRETLGVLAVGLAIGAGLAYAASRAIDSRLYGVAAQDPLTIAWATGLLLVAALSAAYIPAHRASKLDPMTALRQ